MEKNKTNKQTNKKKKKKQIHWPKKMLNLKSLWNKKSMKSDTMKRPNQRTIENSLLKVLENIFNKILEENFHDRYL